jgi:3-oxoacid CoA-transferase
MTFNNRKYLLEESLFADFSLIKAKRADRSGNLQFEKTEQNFNCDMSTAGRIVIAEVEEIVEDGELDPESIHVPAVYVNRVFLSDPHSPFSEKFVEKLTVQGQTEIKRMVKKSDIDSGQVLYGEVKKATGRKDAARQKIITRAAKEVSNGMNVNLGIGIPTLLPAALPKDIHINLQSENGIMGVGAYPPLNKADPTNINAGKVVLFLYSKQSH